ncbi:hypothetical protein D3C76_1676180 [compost metagenome]
MLAFCEEKHLQQRVQSLAPLGSSGWLREDMVGHIESVEQGHQRADQRSIQAADFVVGFDTVTAFTHTDGITQQHTP